jgi:hypothetical protein
VHTIKLVTSFICYINFNSTFPLAKNYMIEMTLRIYEYGIQHASIKSISGLNEGAGRAGRGGRSGAGGQGGSGVKIEYPI